MLNVDSLISRISKETQSDRARRPAGLVRQIESLTCDACAAITEDVENKLPILQKQFRNKQTGEPLFTDDQIRSVAREGDPTPNGIHITWLLKQCVGGRLRFAADGQFEDGNKTREALAEFERLKKIRVPDGPDGKPFEKDINKYKSLGELIKAIRPHSDKLSKRKEVEYNRVRGMELVYEKVSPADKAALGLGTAWQIFKITTSEAATEVAKGTEWCTKDPRWSNQFMAEGPLWSCFTWKWTCEKGHDFAGRPDVKKACTKAVGDKPCGANPVNGAFKPFAQVHFPTNQFMNINDRQLMPDFKYAVIKVLAPVSGVSVTDDPAMAYGYAEAMGDRLTAMYGEMRFREGEPAILKGPVHNIVHYAEFFVKGRWPEAEPIILQHPYETYLYAQGVIKGRWPEGEQALLKAPPEATRYLVDYAQEILRKRWPEAEPLIMRDPSAIVRYSQEVLRSRWPEGEQALLQLSQREGKETSASNLITYATKVIRGRWPEAEAILLSHGRPSDLVTYATEALKGPWPEAEARIGTDSYASSTYARVKNKR